VEALIVLPQPVTTTNQQIVELAAKNRLTAMYPFADDVELGGLMAYGSSRTDLWRRAAVNVDKILKGAKPGDRYPSSSRKSSSSSSISELPNRLASAFLPTCWRERIG